MEAVEAIIEKRSKRIPEPGLVSPKIREEYIEVEPNVRLHITDCGGGRSLSTE